MYTKEYLNAFGYKTNLKTSFNIPKNILIKYNNEEKIFNNVYSIMFLENELYSMVAIEYKKDKLETFETSSKNIEEIIILE